MRRITTTILTLVLTLTLASSLTTSAPSTRLPKSCSCTAGDGSCSASVSCGGGCTATCGNNGDCTAQCSGFFGTLGLEVTFQMQRGTYSQLVSELASMSGKEMVFSTTRPDNIFNVDYKRAVLWDILEMLSDRGTVQIGGQDFEKLRRIRQVLLSGEKISFCLRNTSVNTFVNDMAGLTGLPLRITSGNPMAMANVKLQYATLNDILTKVSEQTGTKIIEEGD